LGPYQILSFIAAGGMGSVYRARDPRMGREVAIKVAAERFSERFSREVRAVAALNHPNICHVYDVGPNYLVMELVEGESPKGPLPLEEALRIARQIADALEEAHEKGIVHRDLKPGNIKIRPDGTVKVLDFGLAKATSTPVAQGAEDSPTISMAATQAGVILGTAAYMSPEQARGKPVDRRADIWAFGVVLYEMLTGARLFQGEDLTETLASVVKEEPQLDQAPAKVRRLLRKCLEKDPRRRLRDIGDVWELLEEAPAGQIPTKPAFRWLWPGIAALLAVIAAIALWGWLRPAPPATRIVTHFTTALPDGTAPMPGIAVSRDGSRIAFAGGPRREIYVRTMDQLETRPIPGTEGAAFPAFSPDGQWISYVAVPRHLRKVPVAGGPSVAVAEVEGGVGPPTPAWGDDGNILFSRDGALFRVPSSGGQPQLLATPDAKSGELWYAPQVLPGGRNILVTVSKKGGLAMVLNLQTGDKKMVLEGNGIAQFANTDPSSAIGHLVYLNATTPSLMAVPFDRNRLQAKGSPIPVLDRVQTQDGTLGAFGFSDSGTLAYVTGLAVVGSGATFAINTLVWVDRKGSEQRLPAPPRGYTAPAVSPDGEHVAVQIREESSTITTDIWVYALARGTLARVTSEGPNFAPVWTPDAKLIYTSNNATARDYGLRSIPADGSGSATAVSARQGSILHASSVSPDGKLAIGFGPGGSRTGRREAGMWLLTLAAGAGADAKPQPFLDSQFSKCLPQFSPDGRGVAYQSDETGRNEVYVVSYPSLGGKVLVSNDGGTEPRWARSGRELFYRNGDKMMAVDIQTTPALRAGAPQSLFEGHYFEGRTLAGDYRASYDVSPDGKRFLMLKPVAGQNAGSGQLHIVVNWFEELRRRVPVER